MATKHWKRSTRSVALPATLKVAVLAALLGGALGVPGPAAARELPPEVRGELVSDGDAIRIELRVTNPGASALGPLFPVLELGSEPLELDPAPELAAGASVDWVHPVPRERLESATGATLPLPVRIFYEDATAYPLSVPLVLTHPGQPPGPGLDASLELDGSAEVPHSVVALRNPGGAALAGSARMFASAELAPWPGQADFRLGPGEETRLVFSLRARGGLPGQQRVYAVVQLAEPAAGARVLSGSFEVTPAMLARPPIPPRVAALAMLVAVLFFITAFVELRAAGSGEEPTAG